MAYPSVSASAGAEPASRGKASKLSCLCSPTNHPGSFRCSRHRTPRASQQLPSSSSFVRSSQQLTAATAVTGIKSGRASRTTTSKGRHVLRAHLTRLLASAPLSPGAGDHRRCREFKPHLSRLGRLAAASS